MKAKEIRDLGIEEIRQRIADEENELTQARFRHAVGTLQRPTDLRTLRRNIARMKTILAQKEAGR